MTDVINWQHVMTTQLRCTKGKKEEKNALIQEWYTQHLKSTATAASNGALKRTNEGKRKKHGNEIDQRSSLVRQWCEEARQCPAHIPLIISAQQQTVLPVVHIQRQFRV